MAIARPVAVTTAVQSIARARRLRENRPPDSKGFGERYRRFALATPDFHGPWYEALDDPSLERIYIQAPREHAKTSVVLTYAARRLAEAPKTVRIGVVSQTDPLAQAFIRELAHEVETNDLLRAEYPDLRPGTRVWNQHELVLAGADLGKDVSVFAVGAGGQITGRHEDVLIVDDLESHRTVESPGVRAKTRSWFTRELLPTASPGAKVIVIGTRKHFDDLYNYLIRGTLDEGGSWTILDSARSVFRPDGSPLWPEMWSGERLVARKRELDGIDVLAWPQEYLNEPLPSETQMFSPLSWTRYRDLPAGCTVLNTWDLAISTKTTADYTVGVAGAVDGANNLYLLDVRRGRWDFHQTQTEIERLWRDTGASSVGIEEVGYQAAAVQEAISRSPMPVVRLRPDKDKVTRARLLEARSKLGKVLVPYHVVGDQLLDPPWWPDLAQELAWFPAGSHDDQVDALAYLAHLATEMAPVNTDWEYGLWRCLRCGTGFRWSKARPCPKCGLTGPDTYPATPEEMPLQVPDEPTEAPA